MMCGGLVFVLNIDFGIWHFGNIGLLLLYGFCFFFIFKPYVLD